MIPILATNEEFRSLHQRNLTRTQNFDEDAIANRAVWKAIESYFCLLKKGTQYDPSKIKVVTTEVAQAA